MKKLLCSLLVLICVIALCGGCVKEKQNDENVVLGDVEKLIPEDNALLPVNLKLGMGEAEVTSLWGANLWLSKEGERFESGNLSMPTGEYWSFYGIDDDILYAYPNALPLDPEFVLVFDGAKRLSGYRVSTRILDGDAPAEYLFNQYMTLFEQKTGQEFSVTESETKLSAMIESESIKVAVCMMADGNNYTVLVEISSKVI